MKPLSTTAALNYLLLLTLGFLSMGCFFKAATAAATAAAAAAATTTTTTTTTNNNSKINNDRHDQYQSDKFKAPNADTDPTLVKEWAVADEQLWSYVRDKVPAVLDHTGSSSFDEHLRGVQAVLRYWDSPQHLTDAGLFHSIYGTEGFQGYSLPLTERHTIQNLIGMKAEKLCFIFCMVDRSTVDETVFAWTEEDTQQEQRPQDHHASSNVAADARTPNNYTLRARPELGRFEMTLTKEEWLDLIELTLADWLEQVEGAATKPSSLFQWKTGEAYSYRRLAYRKMGDILTVEREGRLSTTPKRMLQAVMGTEPSTTRHLVQGRTPPVSDAAARALAALRANGEDIPEDLTPQPLHELRLIHQHEEL